MGTSILRAWKSLLRQTKSAIESRYRLLLKEIKKNGYTPDPQELLFIEKAPVVLARCQLLRNRLRLYENSKLPFEELDQEYWKFVASIPI